MIQIECWEFSKLYWSYCVFVCMGQGTEQDNINLSFSAESLVVEVSLASHVQVLIEKCYIYKTNTNSQIWPKMPQVINTNVSFIYGLEFLSI